MDYALNCIIGKRENQEDYGVIKSSGSSGGVLAVIADGMGGQVAGEVASSTAVNEFFASFNSNNSKNLPLKLRVALDKANHSLAKSIAKNPKLHGMGATLIAAHIEPEGMHWISVGDSILYLYRDKKLQRLNEDHSMVPVIQESIRRGKITPEEALVHPHRNALRSALTGEEIPIVDLREELLRLKTGDLIVLATDGILTLNESEISSILDRCKVESANFIASQLLEAVNQINKPRQDNTLVEVIKVTGGARASYRWAHITTVISIFVISAVLALFAWINSETILQSIGVTLEKGSSEPKTTVQKVEPLQLEPTPAVDLKEPSSVDQAISTKASKHAADSLASSKDNKSSQHRKSPADTKSPKSGIPNAPKVDEPQKQVGPPQETVKSSGLETSGDADTTISSKAKTDSVPNSDGERAKKLLEGGDIPKVNTGLDRKE